MDKHGLAALLVAGPPKEEEDEDGGSVRDLKAHMLNAAHELLDAIHKDDADKLCDAFCTMHKLDHAVMEKEDAGEADEGYEGEAGDEDEPGE